MLKRYVLAVLVLALLLSTTAYAATNAVNVMPAFTVNGTSGNCYVKVIKAGKVINATLELRCGNTLVASWSDTKTGRLVIDEDVTLVSGKTYTLTVSGTIDGVAFTGGSITKTA